MNRHTHLVPVVSAASIAAPYASVTLAGPPAWERDDRAATAPPLGSIRYEGPLDMLRYDPILRSADALGAMR